MSIHFPISIVLLLGVPFATAFIPCGPATLKSLQIKSSFNSPLASSTSLLLANGMSHPKYSIRQALPSILRQQALRMSESANDKTCKLAVGDQVRVLVKTITLAKSAVQAGTSYHINKCEEEIIIIGSVEFKRPFQS